MFFLLFIEISSRGIRFSHLFDLIESYSSSIRFSAVFALFSFRFSTSPFRIVSVLVSLRLLFPSIFSSFLYLSRFSFSIRRPFIFRFFTFFANYLLFIVKFRL